MQLHREQQDQKNRKPEVGDGNADLGQAHEAHITPAFVVGGRNHSRSNGQHGGDAHGHDGQRHGDRKAFPDQLGHGRAIDVAVAHVAVQKAGYPLPVAHRRGLVQA
ncbi:hypothetical protein SDC9_175721 [bioreactor metagenome]|uniref:Uncharacterized protein n=1 Tax=bioreactor metagenome TaxID=1076179 RepID=A0A645GPY0_9ZZZZ